MAARSVIHPFRLLKSDVVPAFKNSQQAFEEAIASGRLSADPVAGNFAGNYLYMGTWDGKDAFKHVETREYLPAVQP